MAYIVFHTTAFLNEDDTSSMTAAALKAAGITSVKGYGGIDVPVNSEGYLTNPAQHLPDGMLDKLKRAWTASDGNANTFFNQNIDGTPVKDILAQCPSQQSYGIAKELGLPDGTSVPCKAFTDHDYQRIKYNSSSSAPASDGTDGGTSDGSAGGTGDGAAGGTGDGAAEDGGTGDGAAGGTGDDGTGDGAADGTGDWWSFFGSKEFLIGAVAVAGVIALIKTLGNTIKARFRKCAKVLYRMQKDFGTKENGMDMKAVLPGVGSKIMDWLGMLWGSKTGKGKNKGALGLRPFVDNYKNELSADYQEARKAFNMIATAGKGIDVKKGEEQTSGNMNNLQSESQAVIYSSFSEMLKSEPLNEEEEAALNEALGVGAIVALGSVAIRGGMYLFSKKDKNGNDVGSAKAVQVTHQSTREICYSILNMFFSKYFNMKAVSEKMGMNVDSLGDIDKSNVDKFAKLAQAMKQEQASGKGSKMYARVEKNYNQMIDAYVRIANNVVNNFEKYTKNSKGKDGKVKTLSEKDSNLLVASVEKLRAEVNRQEDGYRNNFFRVVNAIITSPEYTTYLDFIIKDVIPVFKTGLASDADFVLDIVPKAGEYYILHQSNQQTELADGDTAKENVVLARVLGFDQSGEKSKNPVIKFARVALLKDPGLLIRNSKNEYDMSSYKEENLDRTAFGQARGENADRSQNGDNVELTYNKWMALDPIIATNVPGDDRDGEDMGKTKLYHRVVKTEDGRELDEYIFGISTKVKEASTTEFTEDTNISEATGKTEITNETPGTSSNNVPEEISIDNTQQDIVKLACANVTKGTDLAADVKTNQFTGAFIFLGNKCTAKEADEKFKALGFEALDGKTKEKEQIENNIANSIGYTHVARQDADNIASIDNAVKKIETRQTTSEKLFGNLDRIVYSLLQQVQGLNLTANKVTYPISLSGAGGVKDFYTYPKDGKNPYYIPFSTGVLDKRNEELIFKFYPTILDNAGNIVKPSVERSADSSTASNRTPDSSTVTPQNSSLQEADNNTTSQAAAAPAQSIPNASIAQPAQQTAQVSQRIIGIVVSIDNHGHGDIKPPYHAAKLDKESIKKACAEVINDLVKLQIIEPVRGENLGGGTATAESFSIEYDKYFNVAESFMSSFGFSGANKLHVNRTIKAPKSKLTYYALSENAWGDGSKLDPEKYIKESLDAILAKNSTYDEFAKLAKNSHSINLIKIAEDCSYNTALPYNRYQMLTAANPLYEGLVIVRFDKRGKLAESIRLGVKKIYCETI